MEVRNSCSGLIQQNTNDSCIYFQDRALSTYLYVKNFREINLSRKELEKDFLETVISNDTLMSLSDIYLNVLKDKMREKYDGLKHDDAFELDEVVESFSRDLNEDFKTFGVVFFLQDKKWERDNYDKNPLKELIDKPYMQEFFNALELSYSQRVLFILGIANEEWGWLFPDFKNEEYKAHLFCHICEIEKRDEIAYARKMNNELVRLGLFASPWKINSFVYSYFKNETPAFSLQRLVPRAHCDFYDYTETAELNINSLEIMRKLDGFTAIISESDYRNRNFLTKYYNECYDTIYEIKQEYKNFEKKELEFYIFVLSLQVNQNVLFLGKNLCEQLLQKDYGNPIKEMFHKKEAASGILEKVKNRVILSMEKFTEDERNTLLEQGIDILYASQLKLPKKKSYQESFSNFCLEEKIPLELLQVVTKECEKLNLTPEKWKAVTDLIKLPYELFPEEAVELIRNKYGNGEKSEKLRKNSHYCIEALNTSEPISEVTEALKNADEYQNGEYDEESGIKVLLYGISGGGKTAYAEEVSKKMNRSLKIVRPSEVLSKWVGETEQNISRIFKEAAKDHSIILVDEADSFLHNRGDSVNHFEDSKVNSFLIEIERYPGILFCSTNLPDILDKALDRRFNFKIGFKPLTKEGVGILCKSYFSSINIDENQVSEIYNSGDVTPGDFASLSGKLRFLAPEKRNAEYITEELCKIVHGKKRSYEKNTIGFGN